MKTDRPGDGASRSLLVANGTSGVRLSARMIDADCFVAEALAAELSSRGIRAERHVSRVRLPELALDVHADDSALTQTASRATAAVIFDTRAQGAESEGIRVLSAGLSDSPEDAARDAARQWASGVLPPVRSWLTGAHLHEVGKAEMIVAVEETTERYGWIVHQGPLIGRLYCANDSSGEIGPLDQNEPFFVLHPVTHPMAAHRTLFWIEAFAVRDAEGGVDATCRLRNDDWPAGEAALLEWARSWTPPPGCILSKRQFLLFQPATPSQLPGHRPMERMLDERMGRAPWWKRLFARRG